MRREHRAATRQRSARILGNAMQATHPRVHIEGLESRTLLSTYLVTTTADSGAGSLRAQMIAANFHPGADTISFLFRGIGGIHTIHLQSGLPGIIDPLTINGNISGVILGTVRPGIELDGSALGAGENGMEILADNTTLTGLIIDRFSADGIIINGGNHDTIKGNYIGTDPSGAVAEGNGGPGVYIATASASNQIIGNVIADNSKSDHVAGVVIEGAGANANVLTGNKIGTDVTGTKNLGNHGAGVLIRKGAQNNVIGSGATASNSTTNANLIANNSGAGVAVITSTSTGNSIRGNKITSNGGLGIDLNSDGVTLNDSLDTDAGPNNLTNYPLINWASAGSTTIVNATLLAGGGITYRVDFYASDSADATGFGEGKTYLGTSVVTTNVFGIAGITADLGATTSGQWISATATDARGNTSEFSAVRESLAPNTKSWIPIGPAAISENVGNAPVVAGRVSVAVPDPTNPNVMYIGSDSGGVWKTSDWLDTNPNWYPLTDNQASPNTDGYHNLAMARTSHNVLYAATSGPGGRILRTADGGQTWSAKAADTFGGAKVAGIAISPTDFNTVYAALWSGPKGGGVYKSTDGGATWKDVSYSAGGISASDIAIDPSNAQVLYAGFVGAGSTDGLYKSTDGGANWKRLESGILKGSAVGVSIRVSIVASNSNYLYATVFDPALGSASTGGLPHRYRSTNAGKTWAALSALPETDEYRSWHVVLYASGPNTVFVNSDHQMLESTNGGKTWTGVYGEDPVNAFSDDSGAIVMVGDRGIYRMPKTIPANVQNKQGNLQVTEFYTIAINPAQPHILYGVAQDHLQAMMSGGGLGLVWGYAGSGGETGRPLVDPVNVNRVYLTDPLNKNGYVFRSDNAAGSWANKSSGLPTQNSNYTLAYADQRAFTLDPSNHNRLILGIQSVYESTNNADSWHNISGGSLSSGHYVTSVAVAKSHPKTVYASTDDGKFFATDDNGATAWQKRSTGLGFVRDIRVDPSNSKHVFIASTVAGGSGAVRVSTDGGKTWKDLSSGIPTNLTGQTLAVDWRTATPKLYVGTSRGVYASTNLGGQWSIFGAGLPVSNVEDLQLDTTNNLLVAATYGRGAFEIKVT